MPTLATIIARQPYEYRARYADSYWITWINELLEELSGEGLLMPDTDHETGCVVFNKSWITPPAGLRTISKIYNPSEADMEYRYREIENKVQLMDVEIEENESPDAATAFSDYAVDSIKVNIADAAENDYENYLLVITAGTEKDKTILISGNDAAGSGYTKLNFRHALSSALSATKITACYLLAPDYYVMMEYSGSYTDISETTDEVPIDDRYEKRITKAWLRWKTEEAISAITDEARYYEKQYFLIIQKIKGERRTNSGRPIPRYIPGLDQYSNKSEYVNKSYESEL